MSFFYFRILCKLEKNTCLLTSLSYILAGGASFQAPKSHHPPYELCMQIESTIDARLPLIMIIIIVLIIILMMRERKREVINRIDNIVTAIVRGREKWRRWRIVKRDASPIAACYRR